MIVIISCLKPNKHLKRLSLRLINLDIDMTKKQRINCSSGYFLDKYDLLWKEKF